MKIVAILPITVALAACDTQQPAQPEPAETQRAAPVAQGAGLSPPHREEFAAAWAEACPDAQPVNKALCKTKGMGEADFLCDFGLGDDEFRRHNAELAPGDGKWVLADPENACRIE